MVRTSDNFEITLGRKLLSDFGASIVVVGCCESKVFGGSLNHGFQVLRTTAECLDDSCAIDGIYIERSHVSFMARFRCT
jgi:hypothetical protein